MRFKALILALVLGISLLAGCSSEPSEDTQAPAEDTQEQTEDQTDQEDQEASDETEGNTEEENVDVVTTPSIVEDKDAFKKAISKDGTWIIATLKDLSFDEELVLEGEFHDKGDDSKDLYRKIALYEQDEDRNVTARYTLTAPKLVVKSENAKIQGGTFVGDVYVEANGFTLSDVKVEGNVYFAEKEYKESFEKGEKSTVSGSVEVK